MKWQKEFICIIGVIFANVCFSINGTETVKKIINPALYSEAIPEQDQTFQPIQPPVIKQYSNIEPMTSSFSRTAPRRLTDDPRNEYAASMVQLLNGDLLLTYDLWLPDLYYLTMYSWKMLRRSTDGGNTWSNPESIFGGDGQRAWPRIKQTSNGTVWIFYRNRRPPNYDPTYISYIKSTNNGYSWSQEYNLSTRTGPKTGGYLFQPTNNKIWVFYNAQNTTTDYDIYYQTSTDNGNTWLGETPFIEATGSQTMGSIVKDNTGKLWVFYYNSADTSISYRTSIDTGQTWSASQRLTYRYGSTPSVTIDQSGNFWLVYTHSNASYNSEIYYMTSTNNGVTWSDTTKITRFVGMDMSSDLAKIGGQPWLLFHSDRAGNGDIYSGILGQLTDPSPPPYLVAYSNNPVRPRLTQQFSPVGLCLDETGISSVNLVYSINGGSQPNLTLYDDGSHGDYNANDGWYGNFRGPFTQSTVISAQFRITDINSNTIQVPQNPWVFSIAGVHDTSNLQLFIDPADGRDGDNGIASTDSVNRYQSALWPRGSYEHYLCAGHTWVGTIINNDTVVSGLSTYTGYSDWSVCQGETLHYFHGLSNLDSYIRIDDRNPYSGTPIGIEVHKRSLSWHSWRYDDFIIQEYVYKNTGQHGNLNNVYIGFVYDFDIAQNDAYDDLVGSDGWRNLSYMFDADGNPSGYIGVRMLSGTPRSHSWWAANYDPINDGAMYRYLVSDSFMTPPVTPADQRVFQSAGPFNIPVGDSVKIVVGMVIGSGLTGLRVNADTMKAVYDRGYQVGVEEASITPSSFKFQLEEIKPNPIRKEALIVYHIATETKVSLKIYDASGKLVRTLVNDIQKPNVYYTNWNGRNEQGENTPKGIYFYRLQASEYMATKKMVMLR
jgi:hypothetical protein